MAKKDQQGASLNPETYSDGGGLLDNERVIFKSVMFGMTDYNGKRDSEVPALIINMSVEGSDDVEQFFTVGKAEDWQPSRDGTRLIAVGSAKTLNKNSNTAILMKSIVEAGFPTDLLEDDCSIFEGMDCHVVRIPAPKRTGLSRSPREDGKEYEQTSLVVDKIHTLPGDGEGAGSDDSGSGASDEIVDRATEVLMDVLTDDDAMAKSKGKLTKKQITVVVYKATKDDPNKGDIMKLVIDNDFLGDDARPWTFDEKKGTITP